MGYDCTELLIKRTESDIVINKTHGFFIVMCIIKTYIDIDPAVDWVVVGSHRFRGLELPRGPVVASESVQVSMLKYFIPIN